MGFWMGELVSWKALLSCRAAFLSYRWEPQINGNSLWHPVGALGEAGTEVLCHFGLGSGVSPREGEYVSCHEQHLMQRELEMPSETYGPAKDIGSPRRCDGVHRELVLLCFLAGSFLELRQKQI